MAKLLRFDRGSGTYLDLADKYVAEGRLVRAVRAMKLSLEEDFSADALLALAETYYNNGLYPMAEAAFLQLYPNPEYRQDALLGLYLVCLQVNDGMRGHFYLNEMVKNGINLPKEEMDELIRMSEERAGEERRSGYKLVYPETDESKLMRAGEMILSEQFEDAYNLLSEIKETSKSYAEARGDAAVICLMTGDMQGAVKESMRALRVDEQNLKASSILVTVFAERGQVQLMNNLADRMAEIRPKDEQEALNVAITMCQIGRHDTAVRYLRQISERRYEKGVMELLSVALYNDGKVDEALRTVGELSALYGDRSNACIYRERMTFGMSVPYFIYAHRELVNDFVTEKLEEFDLLGWDKVVKSAINREILGYAIRETGAGAVVKKLVLKRAGREYLKSLLMTTDIKESDKIRILTALAKKGERPYVMGVAYPARFPRIPAFLDEIQGIRTAYIMAAAYVSVLHPRLIPELNGILEGLTESVKDFRGFKRPEVLAYLMVDGLGDTDLTGYFALMFNVKRERALEYKKAIVEQSTKEE